MFAVQEEFKQKDKIIARIARVKSSLYCFIEDFFNGDVDLKKLPIELIEALKSVVVLNKQTEKREAFLFNLDKSVDLMMLKFSEESYVCVDAHLTVDKWCATDDMQKSSQGFSMSHYTTKYTNIDKNKILIIHVYFNSLGKYINHQIKLQINAEKPVILAANDLDIMIKKDYQLAIVLLQTWLKARAIHYCELYEASKVLEAELRDLFDRRCQNRKFLVEYSKIADRFIKKIERLNKYSDRHKDQRDQIIKDTLIFLNAEAKIFSSQGANKSFAIVAQDIQTTKSSSKSLKYQQIIINQDQSRKLDVENLITTLMDKYQKFKSKNADGNQVDDVIFAVDQYIFAQEFRFLLLRLEWLEHNIVTNEYPEIAKIEERVKNFPNLIELFKEKCLALDLKAVKILFPHVVDLVDPMFYCHDLFYVAINTNDLEEDIVIKIYEYLFENSEPYKNFVISDYVELMFAGNSSNEYYGMLAKLFLHNKLKLVEMFINLGLTLDSYGFIRGSTEIMYTVEYFIRYSDSNDKLLLAIKLLLEYHFELLSKETEASFFFTPKNHVEIFENKTKLIEYENPSKRRAKAIKNRYNFMEKLLDGLQSPSLIKISNKANSYLELIFSVALEKNFCDEVVIMNLKLLAENYALEEIFLLLSFLTNYSDLKKILIDTDNFEMKFANLDKSIDKQGISPIILMLIGVIYDKINKPSLEVTNLEIILYKHAASLACLENITALQHMKAINYYKSYMFLLIFKNTQNKKDVLERETKILNVLNQMSKLLDNDLEVSLSLIIDVVTNSLYSEELIKNRVYQEAVIKLAQPIKRLETQECKDPILFMQSFMQDNVASQTWFAHENISSKNSISHVIKI